MLEYMSMSDEFFNKCVKHDLEHKAINEDQYKLSLKQYKSRRNLFAKKLEEYCSYYNLSLDFPIYKYDNSDEAADLEHSKLLDEENNKDNNEKEDIDKYKTILKVKNTLKGLRDWFETPVGSMLLNVFVNGPGNVQDINIIRALYNQYVLGDHLIYDKEQLEVLNSILDKSDEVKQDLNLCFKYYGKNGYDATNGKALENYRKGIDVGGYDYKRIADSFKNKYHEKSLEEMTTTLPTFNRVTQIFNISYQLLYFNDTRNILIKKFGESSTTQVYIPFFDKILEIGSMSGVSNVDKMRMFMALYFVSRTKTNSNSIYQTIYFTLLQMKLFNNLLNTYRNLDRSNFDSRLDVK